MIRCELETPRLLALARRRKLPPRQGDMGYVVHCALGELFGRDAPQPFAHIGQRGRHSSVLAYAQKEPEALQAYADAFADPSLHTMVDWSRFDARQMPVFWPVGHRLGFRLRCCPVQRMHAKGDYHRRGAEVDVFVARCWKAGDSATAVKREELYCQWLATQIKRYGGARLIDAELGAFQRECLVRRTQGGDRKSAICERPDALMGGTLEVTDSSAFTALLRRGIGRHRAFGFGMLLLRPAD